MSGASHPVVSVEGIGKEYSLGPSMSGGMLREQIMNSLSHLFNLGRVSTGLNEKFWALKGISFDVSQGEALGIIGHNGAGKTTLLKVLSEITEPTTGQIRIRGRIVSLLGVGTGFHPELTGRENIYLNGSILGMERTEINRKYEEIVEFSGIGKFIDTPVKRYSSGMYVRLAFSVAVHLEPEIIVIDEVLAVGDLEFQQRCFERMRQLVGGGRTILFVSHNMTAVSELCQRCLLLEHGRLIKEGSTSEVISDYLEKVPIPVALGGAPSKDAKAWISDVKLLHDGPSTSHEFLRGETLTVEIAYQVRDRVDSLAFGIAIEDRFQNTRVFACLSSILGLRLENVSGQGRVRIRFPHLDLVPGRYPLTISLNAERYQYDRRVGVRILDVVGDDESGLVLHGSRNGVVWLKHEWDLSC